MNRRIAKKIYKSEYTKYLLMSKRIFYKKFTHTNMQVIKAMRIASKIWGYGYRTNVASEKALAKALKRNQQWINSVKCKGVKNDTQF